MKRSRLADPCLSHNDNTTKNLFPMEPHRTKRGMLSRHYNQEVQTLSLQKQSADLSNVVIQGLPWEKLHPRIFLQKPTPTEAETTKSTTMAKENMEETGQGRSMKAEESDEPRTIYWVMPSYAEPFKNQIMQILAKEKINLCKSKTFENVFVNINFKLAFANSKNIKQLIVRTKV